MGARLGALAALAAAAGAWLVLGPPQLGGSTSYVTTLGVSMEPGIHRGDLVLVRRRETYRVGDVVAYRSRSIDRVVLHRIVARRDGRFVLEGDANAYADPGTVAAGDIVGREFVRVPAVGAAFGWLHRPWLLALLAAGAVVGLVWKRTDALAPRRRDRQRRRRLDGWTVPAELAHLLPSATVVAGGATVLYLALAATSLATPAARTQATDRAYSYTGAFSYTAAAAPSAAYPAGRVVSGQAVFTRLVDRVDFRFAWQLHAPVRHRVAGDLSLAAVVSDGLGWTRRIELAPSRTFAADRGTISGRLDLTSLRALIAQFEHETGRHVGLYRVAVVPRLALRGSLAGRPVASTYAPTLDLTFGDEALQVAPLADGGRAALTRTYDVPGTVRTANRVGIGPLSLPVGTARVVGGVGLLLSALALAGLLRAGARLRQQDPVARELARSGQSVVPIEDERRAARLVDVRHLAGLIRIARRYDRMILHAQRTGAYLVEDDDVVYRWRPVVEETAEAPPLAERRDLRTRPWASTA